MSQIGERQILTTDAPAPAGTYCQARRIGSMLQVSGQLGISDGATTISEQTRRSLHHVQTILEASGASWTDVLTVRVYLAADELFDEFDVAYASVVPRPFPARVTVSAGLAPGALVEIDALAVLGS